MKWKIFSTWCVPDTSEWKPNFAAHLTLFQKKNIQLTTCDLLWPFVPPQKSGISAGPIK